MTIPRTTMLACLLAGLTGAVHAEGGVTRLWETEARLRNPESIVPAADGERYYVSNVDGEPNAKDGKGFISLLDKNGHILKLEWVSGLNAPKGLARVGERLYVSDIDELVEIDTRSGTIVKRYPAEGAQFLNDVAADAAGNVYVSGMLTNRIYRLHDGTFDKWLESPELANPNGVTVRGDQLLVGAWGVMTPGGFATKVPGHVKVVSLATKQIRDFGGSEPVGNLDGIEPMADGSVLVTDWMAGGLMRVTADGKVHVLDKLAQGSADLGYVPATGTVLVPMMNNGTVIAFHLD
ncbi:hypothetical protein G3580_04345 [Nitrogeniibacter mangrovi]|uniref:SMP-30/Gluconolactonase/LRE-like region domain-containing protein n=1 Tax=Nitrogeniibacter mangrovi TaxID=2016596 RepID=A0A6C1B040_9RHOO|nr:hypothetical protein [Nitrogeniibacter mangrovi]QID16937.1 hypothetical protein G3580_04345 [Nitrogeniibacter mangrovi]